MMYGAMGEPARANGPVFTRAHMNVNGVSAERSGRQWVVVCPRQQSTVLDSDQMCHM